MNLSGWILKAAGWKVEVGVPDLDKCIICVAPHTSNWDFVMCELAYHSVGRKAGFLMKDTWFFFPLGCIFRAIGGIPVHRSKSKKGSLVESVVEKFRSTRRLQIAITPEGTRSRTTRWHTGFLQIAVQAGVPCVLAAIDFSRKVVMANEIFHPTGDMQADLRHIKNYYKDFKGKYPEKFTIDNPED